jgi:hypothetical protein
MIDTSGGQWWITGEISFSRDYVMSVGYFPFPLALFPNAFPSNPGRDLPLPPLCFSFLFSFLLAILSARFFCFAAMFAVSCSFRSALIRREN